MDVYPAGEAPIVGADSRSLCRSLRLRGALEPYFASSIEMVSRIVADVIKDGDILLTQAAGNVVKIAKHFAQIELDIDKLKEN